jgi:hypothetical protein
MITFEYTVNAQNPIEERLFVIYKIVPHTADGCVANSVPYRADMTQDEIRNQIIAYAPVDKLKKMQSAIAAMEIPDGSATESDIPAAIEAIQPSLSESELREKIAREIALVRFYKETEGITVNGIQLPTDRNTQQVLTAMYIKAIASAEYTVQFKTGNGFITLGSTDVIALGDAVHAHVQAAFNREAELVEQLYNGQPITSDMF